MQEEMQRERMAKEIEFYKHRVELIERQMGFACQYIDNLVPVLFGERLGQKELETDMMFKAIKQLRKLVDKTTLGSPQVMARDYSPPYMSTKQGEKNGL